MKLNLDVIRGLDANKSYYVSNKTGEIKEAGAWQKFKCALGVGDGRRKAAKLVDAVKTALLDEAGQIANDALAGDLKRLKDAKSSVSGSALKEVAARFAADNGEAIRKTAQERAILEATANVSTQIRLRAGKESKIAELVRSAIDLCGGDKDALKIVARSISEVLVDGRGDLREGERLKTRIDSLLASLAELREAAAGDATVYALGVDMLAGFEGKGVAPGIIIAIIRSVRETPLPAISRLNAGSGKMAIHRAVSEFRDASVNVLKNPEVARHIAGGNEIMAFGLFVNALLIANLAPRTRQNVAAALAGRNASTLAGKYYSIGTANDVPEELEENYRVCDNIATICNDNLNYIERFMLAVNRAEGRTGTDERKISYAKNLAVVDDEFFRTMRTEALALIKD